MIAKKQVFHHFCPKLDNTKIAGMRDESTINDINRYPTSPYPQHPYPFYFRPHEFIAQDPDVKRSPIYNGCGEILQPQPVQQQQPKPSRPYIKIIEQPASKAVRFRYDSEGRSASSIPGASSTARNRTFPAIQVVGYRGRAIAIASCVTKDKPYRPHPHNLIGREGCKKGVCTMEIPVETMCATFSNLRIRCAKKKDFESSLKLREEIRVDPFRTGFGHRHLAIDVTAVRLCFQVILEDATRGRFTVPLTPVVSEPIYDKKALPDLQIVKLSHCSSYADGGRNDLILLCEKVFSDDIQVRFFEEKNGEVLWEGFAEFQPSQVHKQTAICFKAPRYHTPEITEPVKVFIQLWRPSDGARSDAVPFQFLPRETERQDGDPCKCQFQRKRRKNDPSQLLRLIVENEKRNNRSWNIPMQDAQEEARVFPDKADMMFPARFVDNRPPPSNNLADPNVSPPIDVRSWDFPATSVPNPIGNVTQQNDLSTVNLSSASGVANFLNLESHQIELKPIDLNSGDLSAPEMMNLSESLTHLSLTGTEREGQTIMDSLTRLVNNTIDNICQEEIYRPWQ